jgi:hypothetical protein
MELPIPKLIMFKFFAIELQPYRTVPQQMNFSLLWRKDLMLHYTNVTLSREISHFACNTILCLNIYKGCKNEMPDHAFMCRPMHDVTMDTRLRYYFITKLQDICYELKFAGLNDPTFEDMWTYGYF